MFEYNVFTVIVFAYKLLIAAVLFIVFYLNINFNQFHQSVYGCLKYLEKFKFNVEQFSFDFTLSLYFLKTLINKKEELSRIQEMYGKKQHNLKNYVFPIFISSVNELNEFQLHLKTKFYKLNYKSSNIFSKFVLALVLILFIFVVFKEVIL
ncbi:MAG: hypothetical protein IKL65_02425 [Bacilli bacterium]|nr:hypothetical protein [Bacilli bacterium]